MTAEEPFVQLLRHLGDRAIELNEWFFEAGDLLQAAAQAGMSEVELAESLTILLEKRILLLGRDEAGVVHGGHLTDSGLDAYLQSCRASYLDEQLGVRRKLAEYLYKETPGVSDRRSPRPSAILASSSTTSCGSLPATACCGSSVRVAVTPARS